MIQRNSTASIDQIEGEDIMLFINACLTCTRQTEFYETQNAQGISIDFVHEYILANYRPLYALTLASGANDFNKTLIVQNLLKAGAPVAKEERAEEHELINTALLSLPVNRVFKLFNQLKKQRINNRRTRAVIKNYVATRSNHAFDAIKYKAKFKNLARHSHIGLPTEVGAFLFKKKIKDFKTPLLQLYKEAHYSQQAIYKLPYSIAEGFAEKHGIQRATFLKNIEPNLTKSERLRLQNSASEHKVKLEIDFDKTSFTQLIIYWLSLDAKQRSNIEEKFLISLDKHAKKFSTQTDLAGKSVALVLDRSYSMSGSYEKKRRPLAITFGIFHLVKRSAKSCRVFWSTPVTDEMHVTAQGQSNIASPLVEALSTEPDLTILVSDGFENDPAGMTSFVYKLWKENLRKSKTQRILHLNPCYNAESFDVKKLSSEMMAAGIRDIEDLPTLLEYSQFAEGEASLATLENYLRQRFNTTLATHGK